MFIRAKTRKLKDGNTSYYFYICWTQREGSSTRQYSSYLTSFRETADIEKLRKFWATIREELKNDTDDNKPTTLYYVYEINNKWNIPVGMGDIHFLETDEDYKDYLDVYKWENEARELEQEKKGLIK